MNVLGETPTPEISKSSNAVFVSFNYRLNAFGFLALEELWHDGVTGNYGLRDQVMALNWIQDNIINFGGNPDRVSIMGTINSCLAVVSMVKVVRK